MITGKKKTQLNIENVRKFLSDYDLFKYYMPGEWKINRVTHSPFRKDEHPSFLISNRYGNLNYVDFADGDKKGDCFTFVKQIHNLQNMDDVLKLIDRDFNLGLSKGTITDDYKKITQTYKQPEEIGKRYSLIQVQTRKFTKEELDYWNSYHQDIQDLKDNNVYSVKKVFLNKKLFSLNETELRFGYFYNGWWKIYRPFNSKKTKWVPNNVPITEMDGKEDIKGCKTAFINKSRKDYMVMKKVFPCCCAVQNESVGCFSSENVEYLKANSDKQILSFDSDVPGVKNSQQITKLFDFGYCNVPRKYLQEGIKDWAAMGRIHGLQSIEDYLKEKELL